MDIVKIRKKAQEEGRSKREAERREQKQPLAEEQRAQVRSQEIQKETAETQADFVPPVEIPKEQIPPPEVGASVKPAEQEIAEEIFPEAEQIFDEKKAGFEASIMEVLEFMLADEEYGVHLENVREIVRMRPITEVPRTPEFIKGIVSLRGEMIPVIDLRLRLGLDVLPVTHLTRIIVTSEEKKNFGFIVDRVSGVVRIREDGIEPPPPVVSGVNIEFIWGLGRYSDRLIRLIDLHRVSQFQF